MPADDVVDVADDLGHLRQRILDRLIGPRDLVPRELVVHVSTGRPQIDVLEEVGERPALGSADRVGGKARGLDRLGVREELLPVFGGLDAGVLEGLDVVPVGRLVGSLEEHGVELVLERPHFDDRLGEVLGDGVLREVDRLQRPSLHVLLDEPRLGDNRHVRGAPTLHGRRENGRKRVAGRVVRDVDVGVLLGEAVDDRLERLLLRPRPRAHDRDLPRDRRSSTPGVGGARFPRALLVVVSAARGCEEREGEHQRENEQMTAMFPHQLAPFVPS